MRIKPEMSDNHFPSQESSFERIVRISSNKRDIFIVSDLHLGPGKDHDGLYNGLENFFFDQSFQRFLKHAEKHRQGQSSVLVINGDFIDFLRIVNTPVSDQEFEEWRRALERLGMVKTHDELATSVSSKERTYGFKTDEYKSIWRLSMAMKGHEEFMTGLAEWLISGNSLVIVKGNHDLEWFWPGVRAHFRLGLTDRMRAIKGKNGVLLNNNIDSPRLIFSDRAVEIDSLIYIEHGHQYDRYGHVVGPALLKNGKELNLPFGSFLNRYLINQIELIYPFIDNVRPRESLLPMLFREHFFLGCRVFIQHLPLVIKTIPKAYYRYMAHRILPYILPFAFVLGLLVVSIAEIGQGTVKSITDLYSTTIGGFLLDPIKLIIWTFISYIVTRIVAYFQLIEPGSLSGNAKNFFNNSNKFRYLVFGHTHTPDQKTWAPCRYWNSGTWIPMIEVSNAQVRLDKTFTFVHFAAGSDGTLMPHDLQRWNDDAGRAEPMSIIKSKA